MREFELFMGNFGNGITVCNKAVENSGNYQKICHIAECGKITWYVHPDRIPNEALLKIGRAAGINAANFENKLNKMSSIERYVYLCDTAPYSAFEYISSQRCSLDEKINYLKKVLQERATW